MKIVVEMTSEEFLEFNEWRKDKAKYSNRCESLGRRLEHLANTVNRAVEPDPKKPGKYKIVDQDHMDDLYEMSGDILS